MVSILGGLLAGSLQSIATQAFVNKHTDQSWTVSLRATFRQVGPYRWPRVSVCEFYAIVHLLHDEYFSLGRKIQLKSLEGDDGLYCGMGVDCMLEAHRDWNCGMLSVEYAACDGDFDSQMSLGG